MSCSENLNRAAPDAPDQYLRHIAEAQDMFNRKCQLLASALERIRGFVESKQDFEMFRRASQLDQEIAQQLDVKR
jgi:hypothetical protein